MILFYKPYFLSLIDIIFYCKIIYIKIKFVKTIEMIILEMWVHAGPASM